jgi:hypothetical protein
MYERRLKPDDVSRFLQEAEWAGIAAPHPSKGWVTVGIHDLSEKRVERDRDTITGTRE